MAGMDVDIEIHAPGLDLHHQRWNYHVMFMDEVHKAFLRIAALGWQCFLKEGRGTIFVDRKSWMTVIRAQWKTTEMLFPSRYVPAAEISSEDRLVPLRAGFRQLVEEYEPETHIILTVEHHSANLMSSYLMRSEPGPKEAFETSAWEE